VTLLIATAIALNVGGSERHVGVSVKEVVGPLRDIGAERNFVLTIIFKLHLEITISAPGNNSSPACARASG
jgi:hypothetical protein